MNPTCFCVTAKTLSDSVLSAMLPCCAIVCLLGDFGDFRQSHERNCRWAFVWLPWSAVAQWQVAAQVGLCACSLDSNRALHKYVALQMICKTLGTSWSWFAAFVQNPCQCKSWHWPTTLAKQIRCVIVNLTLDTAIAQCCITYMTCHDIAGCSNDLCRIGKPPASTLGLFGLLVAACTIPDECLQAPTAGIDIPQRHELAFLPNVFPGSVNGHKQANLL